MREVISSGVENIQFYYKYSRLLIIKDMVAVINEVVEEFLHLSLLLTS